MKPTPRPGAARRELVLVGAGHAHVQLLRAWGMRPLADARLTLVVDRAEAVYSGMVPGYVAGAYAAHELEIDAVPLARRAGARVILAAATALDPVARRIALEGRPALAYDLASLDVGASVRGLEVPGVREHALATRPIRAFVDALDARLAAALPAAPREARVVVVGGGAAGVELALTLHARLRRDGRRAALLLVSDAEALLPDAAPALAAAATRALAERGIGVRLGTAVRAVGASHVALADGSALECALAVWATGAAPLGLVARSPLPKDAEGFLRVDETLAVCGHPDLFAAGDCARPDAHPWLPRAGVYAVREGPVLAHNLRARLAGRRLRRYRPQRDFLRLLACGDERALGGKWGVAISGRAAWRLKDAIDRRFLRRFQVLTPEGAPAPHFPAPPAPDPDAMRCGGCAAKLGAEPLAAALARLPAAPPDASVRVGLAAPDDAAALSLPRGELLLASLDGFRGFSDDAFLVGRVAALNALSDVYAKGGRPRHALALVTVPDAEPGRASETLYQVLAGVRAALDPLGVALVGGHTTAGPELFVGLSVTGSLEEGEGFLAKGGLRPGDALVLGKPLGTGVLLAADALGRARGAWLAACHASLLRPNAAAARAARRAGAHAMTDVSGFGLAGHLLEMLRASGLSASLELAALPALPGARELLAQGLRSTFHAQNAALARHLDAPAALAPDDPELALLFDPQTHGGLLVGLAEEHVAEWLAATGGFRIGRCEAGAPGRLRIAPRG